MKTILVAVGVLLAALGGWALVAGGITYTENEQIVDVGPIQASADIERKREIPPLAAGLVMAAGVGLAVYGATRE